MRKLIVLLLAVTLLSGCGRTALEYIKMAEDTTSVPEKERLINLAIEKDPEEPRAKLFRAGFYVAQKKYNLAIADYDSLLQTVTSADQLSTILYWRGMALELSGDFHKAIESYTKALESDPWAIWPVPARASALLKDGKYRESMDEYQKAIDKHIDAMNGETKALRSKWRFRRGIAAFCAGEMKISADEFNASILESEVNADKARALLNLYFVACRMGNKTKADEVLKAYAKETSEKLKGTPTPWIFTALWYVAGTIDDEKFLNISKGKAADIPSARFASYWYYVGAKALIAGNTDAARDAWKKAVDTKDTQSFEYHLASVESERLLYGGKTAGDYVSLAASAPTQEKKLECYDEALRIDPNHPGARLNRALLYSMTGRYDFAIDDLSKLIKSAKDTPGIASALRYRGWIYSQKGDFTAAIKDYSDAVEKDPELWQAREGLALAYADSKKFKESADTFSLLIKQAGTAYHWQIQRGFALLCAGDATAATADFAEVIAKTGGDAIVQTNLMIAKTKAGDPDTARKNFRAYAASLKGQSWENAVAFHVADKLDIENLLKASEHSRQEIQNQRTCRAWYYAGMASLLKGDNLKAKTAFANCIKLGSRGDNWEIRLAELELEKLK